VQLYPAETVIQQPVSVVQQREAKCTSLPASHSLGRIVLFSFLLTFILARLVVFLIMSRRLPDLYLHLGGTHIHHLNYGIFLLAGVGVGLTFDEFGMWVRLGGSYWQRASVDAVGVLAAVFGLIAYAPKLRDFRPRHWGASAMWPWTVWV